MRTPIVGRVSCRLWLLPIHNGMPASSSRAGARHSRSTCDLVGARARATQQQHFGLRIERRRQYRLSRRRRVLIEQAQGRDPSCLRLHAASRCACRRCRNGASGPATCTSSGQRWLASRSLRCSGRLASRVATRRRQPASGAAAGGSNCARVGSIARGACHSAATTNAP